jgi:hypothetical protein
MMKLLEYCAAIALTNMGIVAAILIYQIAF